jgi:hypothetical protein
MVLIQGSMNLDVLEILEDQRAHAGGFGSARMVSSNRSLFTLRFVRGELTESAGRHEAVMLIDGPDVDAESLLAAFSEIKETRAVLHCSVWQNSLRPHEHMLRIRTAERGALKDVLQQLLQSRAKGQLGSLLARSGKLYYEDLFAEN